MPTFDKPSTISTDGPRLEMDRIVKELQLLFNPPKAVQGGADASVWLRAWIETVLSESHDAAELQTAWLEFKRIYKFTVWPQPGVFCETIRATRADKRLYSPVESNLPRLATPDYHRPELVTTEVRNATLTALAQADYMARSDNPLEAGLGRALVKLGLAFIDKNGQPAA